MAQTFYTCKNEKKKYHFFQCKMVLYSIFFEVCDAYCMECGEFTDEEYDLFKFLVKHKEFEYNIYIFKGNQEVNENDVNIDNREQYDAIYELIGNCNCLNENLRELGENIDQSKLCKEDIEEYKEIMSKSTFSQAL